MIKKAEQLLRTLTTEHLSFEARLGNKSRRQQPGFASSLISHYFLCQQHSAELISTPAHTSEGSEQASPTTVESSYNLGEKHSHPQQVTQE